MNKKNCFVIVGIIAATILFVLLVSVLIAFFTHPDFGHPERVFAWVEVLPETADDISMND